MAGANLDYSNQPALMREVFNALSRRVGLGGVKKVARVAADPTDNLEADEPNALHDIVWNSVNGRVFVCVTYTASDAHTWVRIDGA